MTDLDPTTRAVLRHVASLGYTVAISIEADIGRGPHVLAIARRDHETHEVRVCLDRDGAAYTAACRLAESVGIDLEG